MKKKHTAFLLFRCLFVYFEKQLLKCVHYSVIQRAYCIRQIYKHNQQQSPKPRPLRLKMPVSHFNVQYTIHFAVWIRVLSLQWTIIRTSLPFLSFIVAGVSDPVCFDHFLRDRAARKANFDLSYKITLPFP